MWLREKNKIKLQMYWKKVLLISESFAKQKFKKFSIYLMFIAKKD